MNHKLGLSLAALAIAFSLGYWSANRTDTVETQETREERTDERTIDRGVTVEERTDGSRVTRVEVRETTKNQVVTVDRSEKTVSGRDPQWGLGLYTSLAPYSETRSVTATLDRRIIGGLSAGVYVRYTPHRPLEAGVGLRFEF